MFKLSKLFSKQTIAGVLCIGLSACSTFGEEHYFASTDTSTGEIVNVFRLTVSGGSQLSNARYLAGYYDERAVDLFFNEIDSGDYSFEAGVLPGASKLFGNCNSGEAAEACKTRIENSLTVSQLGSDPSKSSKKSFVLLLSTNADAISQTIGAIAEDSAIKQGLYRLANKDKFQKQANLKAVQTLRESQRKVLKDELTILLSSAEGSSSASEQEYLAILSVLANGLSENAPARFTEWEEAEAWFAKQ